MFFRHKYLFKPYLPFLSINCKNLRNIHISYPSHIRGLKRENYRTASELPGEKSNNVAGDGESFKSNNNFYGIENDEGVIIIDESKSVFFNELSAPRETRKRKEIYYSTPFGIVRRDFENKVECHGEYEKSILSSQYSHTVAKNISSYVADAAVPEFKNQSIQNNKVKSNPDLLDIFEQNKNSVSANNVSDVSEFQTQSELQNEIGDIALNQEPNLSFIDQLYFSNSSEKFLSNETKNSDTFEVKNEFNCIDECYFHRFIDQSKLHTSVASENVQSFNTICDEEKVSHIHEETISNIQQLNPQSVLRSETADVSQNQESDLSFIDKIYFSDNTEKLLTVKGPTSSKIREEFSDADEYHCQKTDLSRNIQTDSFVFHKNSSMSPDNSKIKKKEGSKVHPLHSKDSIVNLEIKENSVSHLMNKDFVNAKSKDTVKSIQNVISINNKDPKNTSTTSYFNKMSLGSKNHFKLNESNIVKEIIADKNSDSFYEKILTSSTKVDIDLNSVFQDKKKDISDVSQSVVQEVCNINYDKNDTIKKLSNKLEHNSAKKVETAYNFVSKLREEKNGAHHEIRKGITQHPGLKLDSKGFRILANQVPDLSSYTRDEILEVLINNVLYSDDDLIVLNKPYNLVIHDSKTTKEPCLSIFLDDMAKELDKRNSNPKLFTVHRIDKETTGCLLLARNELAAQNLKSFFAQRKVMKTYWIMTVKVPDPLEGIIDIPIAEGTVENRTRMVLRPDIPKDMNYKNHCKGGKRAITRYKVISISGNAALVEVKPETGIKHQIRVHFGFGLSCPILGDHKYSHLTKLAPQKLPGDLLQRLQVRQSKVRHIPMHIHARSILIPEYHQDGRNLFAMAPLPEHMSKNLKSLKFKK